MVERFTFLTWLWCKRWQRLLVDAADGALSSREQQRLQRHLARCRRCMGDLQALQQVPERLCQMPLPGAPVWHQQQQDIMAAIRQLQGVVPATKQTWNESTRIGWQRQWPVAIAGTVVVVVVGYLWWQTTPKTPLEVFSTLNNPEVIALLDTTSNLVGDSEILSATYELIDAAEQHKADGVDYHSRPETTWPVLQDLSDDELEMLRDTLEGING